MSTQEIANIYSSINNIQLGLNEVTGNTFSNYNQLSRIVSQQANIYNTLYYGTGNMSTGNLVVSANCSISGNLVMGSANIISNGNLVISRGANISGNISVGNLLTTGWNSSSATHLGYKALSGSASIEWTGIPSWANETTICIQTVSLSTGAALFVHAGISSGYITSGYLTVTTQSNTTGQSSSVSGVNLWTTVLSSTDISTCIIKFSYVGTNGSTYYYNITGTGMVTGAASYVTTYGGYFTTTEKINSIRITTSIGTFDSGIGGVYYF